MDESDNRSSEGKTAPMQYPPPFYYSSTAGANIPMMYYPPTSLYAMWGYSHSHWPQQPYTTATSMQYPTHAITDNACYSGTENVAVSKSDELCDASCENAKVSCDPDIIDSPSDIDKNNINDNAISPEITPSNKTSRTREPSLSTLKRQYSSSSTDATTSSVSPTHHHDNNSSGSSPRRLLDVDTFEQQVMEFTNRRARTITNIKARPLDLPSNSSNSTDNFACMEPLEYYMQTSSSLRRQKFYELLAPDDVILGHVEHKKSYGVHIQIDSFEGVSKHRYISDLNIEGFISLKNLASTVEDQDCLMKDLQPGDVLRAQVLRVVPDEEKVFLTLLQTVPDPSTGTAHLKLGYLEGKSPPPSLRPPKQDDFDYFLTQDPGFSNPHCITTLSHHMGIQHTKLPSLVRQLHHASFPEEDYYDVLKKQQRKKWSMENVAIGVKHFKASEHDKAMKYLNHALEIDADNVEGLVARGALIANKGNYKKAIDDFEKALTINNHHSNAKKYLAETQAAYGKQLEEAGEIQAAVRCYQEALADNPDLESPKRRLHYLEAQIAAARRREEEEKQRKKAKLAAKLRKLMEAEAKSEKKRKKSSDRKHKKKRKKDGKKKKHITHQTESSSSSNDTE